MNKQLIRKNKLSLSLALALGVGMAASSSTMAVELDNNDGLGDAGIFQYYTAQGDWQTFIRIINTSNNAASVKVRFREAANSREVLDFIVFLSKKDMWVAWTDSNATGVDSGPGIRTRDTSCTYPEALNPSGQGWVSLPDPSGRLKGALFSDVAFSTPYDDKGAKSTEQRLAEGHIEIIGIAEHDDNSDFGRAVRHQNGIDGDGEPGSCSDAAAAWEADFVEGNPFDPDAEGAVDTGAVGWGMGNILGMNGYLVNVPLGQGGGYDPDILVDFAAESLHDMSRYSATDPDLDSADPMGFGPNSSLKQKGNWMNCGASTASACATPVTGGADAVSYAFQRASVINEWAASADENNIVWNYYTQWILTFPTKHYYVDLQTDTRKTDDISPTLYDPGSDPSSNNAFSPFHEEFDTGYGGEGLDHPHKTGYSCEPFAMDMYNRDEAESKYASPEEGYLAELCWETNVLVFDEDYEGQGLRSQFQSTVPESLFPVQLDPQWGQEGHDDEFVISDKGWAQLDFFTSSLGGTGILPEIETLRYINDPGMVPGTSDEYRAHLGGLPVTGFMFSIFNTGEAAKNHTTINSHKYKRDGHEGGQD